MHHLSSPCPLLCSISPSRRGGCPSFIDRDFVCSKGINTWTLSHNILVFNVNGSPNEARQISEVVDVLLHYKTHSERMLLAVSRLGKQSLILGYNWLKDHNPKIDWEKGEVEMTCCPLQYEGGCALWKEQACQKRIELWALWSCRDGPVPLFQEELDLKEMSPQTYSPSWELRDWLFCHKLHLAISPPILQRFSQSQWLRKALRKTFQSIPVTSRSNQYWPRY